MQGLFNLLNANVDVGLKHCLALGYHQDPMLRRAFLQLLISLLQHGALFIGVTPKRITPAAKPYLDCLVSPNLAFALAVCESCPANEVDEISQLLFRVFEERGLLLSLLKVLVEREVSLTSECASCACV